MLGPDFCHYAVVTEFRIDVEQWADLFVDSDGLKLFN